jgi:RimJ/RimL family protein N-acetyltransferase
MAAIDSAAKRSAVTMQVGTHIRNTAAAHLYENCGFRLVAASQSFRAVLSR